MDPFTIAAGANVVSGLLGSRSSKRAARAQAAAAARAAEMQQQAQREAMAAQQQALDRQLQAQREGLDLSIGEVRRQYNQAREDWEPWRTTGVGALEQLRGLSNYDPTPTAESVMAEPGYQFGLTQGRNALEGSAAAAGGLYSGRALKELTQYGNDYATTKFNDAWNRQRTNFNDRWGRISSLAGMGERATNNTAAAGLSMGNNVAQMYGNNANAASNAWANFGNNRSNLLTNTASSLGNIDMSNANAQAAGKMHRAKIWGDGINQLAGMAMMPGAFGGGGWAPHTTNTYGPGAPGGW